MKLAAVARAVVGASARRMLEARMGGEEDVEARAPLAHARRRRRIPALRPALVGHGRPHQRVLLRRILDPSDFLAAAIAQVQAEIDTRRPPYAEAMTRRQSIPGINTIAAATIIAELGTDMARCPSAQHWASWAGRCPGKKPRGGKRLHAGITEGDPWLRGALGAVVWALTHTQANDLVAHSQRLVRRRGNYKAVVAVAQRVLVII
jgi:transposase